MNLRKKITILLIMIVVIIFSGCVAKQNEKAKHIKGKITVAVSIVPQKTFVKQVAGDLADVVVMIPPGNSPANYQPTPKQMTEFSKSKLYFSIGVSAEKANILPKVKDLNKDIKIISLVDEVDKVYPVRYFNEEDKHTNRGRDPHIWLSPKRVKVMIQVIKDELIVLDPNNKAVYEKNAENYIAKLTEIDKELKKGLTGLNQKSFIVYHPSFGYFADDYGLQMVAIEQEGKEAGAKRLQKIIEFAKGRNIKTIFYQEEFDSRQAETIAKEIGGTAVRVAPLSPDYIDNLKNIEEQLKSE